MTLEHDKTNITNTNILITQDNSLNYGYKPNIYVYNAFNADDEDEEITPNVAEEGDDVPDNQDMESPNKQGVKKVE